MDKTVYLDIMEKALDCYSEKRIRTFTERVHREGLTEHGFPRLVVAVGLLLAFGRKPEYREWFLENMDFCCQKIPVSPAAANDFSVREVCLCIERLREKKAVPSAHIDRWIADLSKIDPMKTYTEVAHAPTDRLNNWALFAAVSELCRGRLCGVDTSDFVDRQLATQIDRFDEDGLYRDPHEPMVYDTVGRVLCEMVLVGGYRGKYETVLRDTVDKAGQTALRMQSVTGAMPFGGRSNQCLHNEAWLAADFEYHATRLAEKDPEKAGEYKAAAALACRNLVQGFSFYDSHVKNRFGPDSFFGCERYAYFDKYMITVASMAYLAYFMADDTVLPITRNEADGFSLSPHFHKTFAKGFGWFLEFDTEADLAYDANGLGRIHRVGHPETTLLSVPFPPKGAGYHTEHENPRPMSLCVFSQEKGKTVYGASCPYDSDKTATTVSPDAVTVTLSHPLGTQRIDETYTLTANGLTLHHNGGKTCGFCLPVLDFDGKAHSRITADEGRITVLYEDSVLTYRFHGTVRSSGFYENRNGRYRVFEVLTDTVTVTDGKSN